MAHSALEWEPDRQAGSPQKSRSSSLNGIDMVKTESKVLTKCRGCDASVDPRLQICPQCGACCPGCTTEALKIKLSNTPANRKLAIARSSQCGKLLAMHEELGHALMEAIWEIDNLPGDSDAALMSMYGVLDDLEQAIERTYALDPERQV